MPQIPSDQPNESEAEDLIDTMRPERACFTMKRSNTGTVVCVTEALVFGKVVETRFQSVRQLTKGAWTMGECAGGSVADRSNKKQKRNGAKEREDRFNKKRRKKK
ncbi:hypothetical protein N7475_000821 [Penicillium sp. IBT 31633x]|nr:hypothetical protein N7475_000821 [Penicillium sp. IBT 31633x]